VPEIVPVELTLPSGTWVTLYQRDWDDADDDSLAFLGGDEAVYAFPNADELSSYAGSQDDHHLAASPLWWDVRRWSRRQFEPTDDERYDLRVPAPRAQDMLAELLVYFRIEMPSGGWDAEPLAYLMPPPTIYGVPMGTPDPRPTGGATIWDLAVEEVDARVGAPPTAQGSGLAMAALLEEVAPGVESFWLGLDTAGAHTLVVRDDQDGWRFLGRPGRLVAAASAAGLMAFVSHGQDTALDAEPWSALRGRDDIDFEPYEDNVVDLDELGRSLDPGLDRAGAAAVLDARQLVQELATWLHLDEVTVAFGEDQPLGRFFVRDLLDLVGGSTSASGRLRDVDFEPITTSWQACVADIASRVQWVD
jgi:hypothetical protein